MKYLAVVKCPVTFPAENAHGLSSEDMLPRLGITPGLESRHLRVLDARITAVCIWDSTAAARDFFNDRWFAKAADLWGDDYQTRLEVIDDVSAA